MPTRPKPAGAPSSRRRPSKSERTRRRILDAAEVLFARHGYEGTRVDAIARAADIRRATLFYHFRDKAEVYDAVLGGLSGLLLDRMRKVFAPGPSEDVVEPAVSAYFDFLTERPSAARILLREVADAEPGRTTPLIAHVEPMLEEVGRMLAPLRAAGIDPVRFVLTVTGASVFFVAGTPLLSGHPPDAGSAARELASQKAEVVRLVRRLLGLPERLGVGPDENH